jgi:hypothetical protein
MYFVSAESRLSGEAAYVSPPLPNAKANELASALRRHTRMRILIESVPAVPTGELLPHSNAN